MSDEVKIRANSRSPTKVTRKENQKMASYYDFDMLGQDPAGRVSGMHPMYGAAIGSGLGTATSEAVQFLASGKLRDHAEGVGFGVATAAGVAMMFLGGGSMRAAGWAAILAAAANNGIRYVVDLFMPSTQEAVDKLVVDKLTTDAAMNGYALQALNGAYNLQQLNGAYNFETLSAPPADAGLRVLNGPGFQEMSQMASAFGTTGI